MANNQSTPFKKTWSLYFCRFCNFFLFKQLTFAACFDVTALAGGYWVWKQLRHNEENRLYYYENYPRILGVYYWGLNVLSFGERLGDKQQDYDIGKWVYEDVQDGKSKIFRIIKYLQLLTD